MNKKIPEKKRTEMTKNCLSIDRVNLVPQRSQRKGDQREISQTLRGDSLLLHFGHCIGVPS